MLTGIVEGIDFTQNRVVLEGRRVKLGEIIRVSVPSRFEEEDDYSGDEFAEEYDAPRSASPWDLHTRAGSSPSPFEEYTDGMPYYGRDRNIAEAEEPFVDYWPDDVPDYEMDVTVRQKETPTSRRPRKTILYTAKNGYRPPYAARA